MARVTPRTLARFLDDRANNHPILAADDRQYSIYADELHPFIEIIQSIPPPPMVSFDMRTNARLRARLMSELAPARRPEREPWLKRLAWRFESPIQWVVTHRPRIGRIPVVLAAFVILLPTLVGRAAASYAEDVVVPPGAER